MAIPQVVQSVKVGQAFPGGSPDVTTPAMTVTPGNTIAALVSWQGKAPDPSFTVTDSAGDLFVLQTGYQWESGTENAEVLVFLAFDVAGGSTTVEVKWPGGAIGTLQVIAVEVAEANAGVDVVVPNAYSTVVPTTCNDDLLLMLYGDGLSAQTISATPPNGLVASLFSAPNENIALVQQNAGLASPSDYTVAIDVSPGGAGFGTVGFGIPAVNPAHALSVGNVVQGSVSGSVALTLPPITVRAGSGLCVVVGWPKGNPGISVVSVTGGPSMTLRRGIGGNIYDGLEAWTADSVAPGTYTLTVTWSSAPTGDQWASAVEVTSTYSGGAAFDSVSSGVTTAGSSAVFQAGLYYVDEALPANASVEDLYLFAVGTEGLSAAGILPSALGSLGGATTVGTRLVVQSSGLSPAGFGVMESSVYALGPDANAYASFFNGGADVSALALSFKPVGVPDPLEVTAAGVPSSGQAPLEVMFTTSVVGGKPPYTYAWTFGDGGTSVEQNPTHVYAAGGTFLATVTVTDASIETGSASVTTTVSSGPSNLSVEATVTPNWGPVAPLATAFTAKALGGTAPYTYAWDFGDGTGSSQQNPMHQYAVSGWYTPTVTARDSSGNMASARLTVTVGLPPGGGGNNTQPCAQGILAPVQVLPSGPALETLPVPASINNVPSAYYDLCYQVYKNPDGSAAILVPPPHI